MPDSLEFPIKLLMLGEKKSGLKPDFLGLIIAVSQRFGQTPGPHSEPTKDNAATQNVSDSRLIH